MNNVSIPMPTVPLRQCFNPRARGGRDDAIVENTGFSEVSIHAPAGGATGSPASFLLPMTSFNPRARGGRDLA